ncbi:MAG: AbrB/MazE/SpoVT family DNA-binding domain-containing protein [Lachnospiraceae bacterium]
MNKKAPKGKYAWTVKIGEKGQFVIPKEARELFDIHPGDTIIVLGDEKRGIAIPPKSIFTKFAEVAFDSSADEPEV